MNAEIFNIQSFSLHDGPGIRTTVFFKGCPLKCLWCHNPESHKRTPQLLYYREKCIGCGACVKACPKGSVELIGGRAVNNRSLCNGCGRCVDVCPAKAREISGKAMSFEAIMEALRSDQMFYEASGGGVTFSGGEPLVWPEMVTALAEACRAEGIHTAIETSGYGEWDRVCPVFQSVHFVIMDLKAVDSELHRKLTGVSNETILANARRVCHTLKKPMLLRIPVVPGCNDSEKNIRETGEFIKNMLAPELPVQLLPYHDLGTAKEEQLEWEHVQDFAIPEEDHMQRLKKILEAMGLNIQIGGAM